MQATTASVVQAGAGTVLATATAEPGATYYRWKAKLVWVDTAYRFLKRTHDSLLQITGQPATGTLDVVCEAANEAGPGKTSKAVSIALGFLDRINTIGFLFLESCKSCLDLDSGVFPAHTLPCRERLS